MANFLNRKRVWMGAYPSVGLLVITEHTPSALSPRRAPAPSPPLGGLVAATRRRRARAADAAESSAPCSGCANERVSRSIIRRSAAALRRAVVPMCHRQEALSRRHHHRHRHHTSRGTLPGYAPLPSSGSCARHRSNGNDSNVPDKVAWKLLLRPHKACSRRRPRVQRDRGRKPKVSVVEQQSLHVLDIFSKRLRKPPNHERSVVASHHQAMTLRRPA